jgi:predicted flap endonuclease-1-like 5' DNA nuclease
MEQVLNWANRADLARIKGIGDQYADLLEAAGVDTVPELAQRNAEHLHARLTEVNGDKILVDRLPGASEVSDWVTEAKSMPRALHY